MRTSVSVTDLNQEMTQLRKEAGIARNMAEICLEGGLSRMAGGYLGRMETMGNGLKWRASAIRREQSNKRGG